MSAEGEVRMGNANPSVDLRRDGEVAVLTAYNPPVNVLTSPSSPSRRAPALLTPG
jgi:hypothetical protein